MVNPTMSLLFGDDVYHHLPPMYMYGNIKDGLLIIRFTIILPICIHLLPNESRKRNCIEAG